jgi:hypothetical protein
MTTTTTTMGDIDVNNDTSRTLFSRRVAQPLHMVNDHVLHAHLVQLYDDCGIALRNVMGKHTTPVDFSSCVLDNNIVHVPFSGAGDTRQGRAIDYLRKRFGASTDLIGMVGSGSGTLVVSVVPFLEQMREQRARDLQARRPRFPWRKFSLTILWLLIVLWLLKWLR